MFCFPLRLPVFFSSVFGILSLSLCFCSSLFFCLSALLVPLFFFFLSSLQFLLSSSSGFYPFHLCPLVSVLGSFCVSVFFFVLRPWVFIFSLLSGSSLPQFVPSGSILSVRPQFPRILPPVLRSSFLLSLLCSVFFLVFSRPSSGFFVLFLPLFFSSFFSVLVPSLHFFFIPLDALVTACILSLFVKNIFLTRHEKYKINLDYKIIKL